MHKYRFVYQLFNVTGTKRIGGTGTLYADELLESKDHPLFLAEARRYLRDRINSSDRLIIHSAFRVVDEGARPFIAPTEVELKGG